MDNDAGDGVDVEVILSWFCALRGKRDRDRVVASCLFAKALLVYQTRNGTRQ